MTVKHERLWCVQVPKRSGEPVRSLLVGLGAFQRDAAVQRDDDYLYFPVKYEIEISDQFPDARLMQRDFECVEKQTFEDILGFTPSYDMIGDIAIIDADDPDAELIADAIIRMHTNINTVLGALSPVQGEFRVRDFRVVAGEPKTETVHKEYGCQYEIDLARVYFTQRLATERKRIADQVGKGDVVVDMFAGAGPFSILAAKSAKEVVAIDKNPACFNSANFELGLDQPVILFTRKVLVGDVVRYLAKVESEEIRREVERLKGMRIEIEGDIVSIKDIAMRCNVGKEVVRACLDDPEYVVFKEIVVKKELLNEVKDKLASKNIKLYVEARRIIEDIGLSNPDEVLAHLGFMVKWKGLDMGAASIELG
jgi:16S rRNA G966 N2-methylase RsmD